ncbi:conserved hypothetical protein [Solidesulfovibrio fructosivorans JJ]]|uniref:Glycosyl transferase family 2 n=1 Tax=Solidesulfovibrio fructosivorans JJ] TaxID=596151 RepID=E1JW00_SOLFR|nr:hypothetical protein [Solidesulfovibrio fructosivorans]EFL51360.1 conserved hypothetical protein [Solidesulfovibrio fructosivorans JJ]]
MTPAAAIRPLVVILHYGNPAVTKRLADQLAQSDPDPELAALVLDNAAPEPYPDAWKRLPENIYWAGALAKAAGLARDMGKTHLWFCNNDILFTSRPPHLSRALGRLARLEATVGRVGLYSPAFAASPYHPQMVASPGFQYRLARVMDGVAPLVALDCLDAIGGLDVDDNPYGYGVDVWLSARARQAGWELVVDQAVTVRHRHHTAARAVDGFLETAARAEEAYLRKRLGPDWRERVKSWQADFQDVDRL